MEGSVALNAWSPRSSRAVTVWPAAVAASAERVTASAAPEGKHVMVAYTTACAELASAGVGPTTVICLRSTSYWLALIDQSAGRSAALGVVFQAVSWQELPAGTTKRHAARPSATSAATTATMAIVRVVRAVSASCARSSEGLSLGGAEPDSGRGGLEALIRAQHARSG